MICRFAPKPINCDTAGTTLGQIPRHYGCPQGNRQACRVDSPVDSSANPRLARYVLLSFASGQRRLDHGAMNLSLPNRFELVMASMPVSPHLGKAVMGAFLLSQSRT